MQTIGFVDRDRGQGGAVLIILWLIVICPIVVRPIIVWPIIVRLRAPLPDVAVESLEIVVRLLIRRLALEGARASPRRLARKCRRKLRGRRQSCRISWSYRALP